MIMIIRINNMLYIVCELKMVKWDGEENEITSWYKYVYACVCACMFVCSYIRFQCKPLIMLCKLQLLATGC